jgi:hypothetical protein
MNILRDERIASCIRVNNLKKNLHVANLPN